MRLWVFVALLASGGASTPLAPHEFTGCAQLPAATSSRVEIAVRATVDAKWGQPPTKSYVPAGKPRSHLANARTNTAYDESVGSHRVKGKVHWYSPPIAVAVGAVEVEDEAAAVVDLVRVRVRVRP